VNAQRTADKLYKHLARLVQAVHLYPAGSDRQLKSANLFLEEFRELGAPFRVTLLGKDAVVEDRLLAEPTPVERALTLALRRAEWEGTRIEQGIGAEALVEMAEKLVARKTPYQQGKGWEACHLTLETAKKHDLPVANAAVGYLKLLAQSRDSIGAMARGNAEGYINARELVAGLADNMTRGGDLLSPIRNLRHFDEYTFTHALNVSVITMAVLKALGVGEPLCGDMALGALCHDVGKETVPKEILNKPGRLDDTEKAIMDRHPLEGAKILTNLSSDMSPFVPVIAYQHHFRVDLSGYPQALPGQKAHPASELVSIVDTFDALRTVRPYREAFTSENSFSIVLNEARRGKLNRKLVSPLAGVLGVVRIGVQVRLTDNSTASVVAGNREDALLPVLRLADGEYLDLAQTSGISIAGILEAKEEKPGTGE